MRTIKTFDKFINEGKLSRHEIVVVNYDIDFDIDEDYYAEMGDGSEESAAEQLAKDVNLKTGSIRYEYKSFDIKGETKKGSVLVASQRGEYNMYGGPYTPRMDEPVVTLDGVDIVPKLRRRFKKYGWFDGTDIQGDQIDISRTDIWGSIVK
tara:strand:- start:2556 stop:3008 length:453 start_codon:yes stop_codon:yes gene_type:complete